MGILAHFWMKVVYNNCFGGFGLSKKAVIRLLQLGSKETEDELEEYQVGLAQDLLNNKEISERIERLLPHFSYYNLKRHDPLIIQVVEELGDEANGEFAKLKIVDTCDEKYRIKDYDGKESVYNGEERTSC